jgi:hypothetical protein
VRAGTYTAEGGEQGCEYLRDSCEVGRRVSRCWQASNIDWCGGGTVGVAEAAACAPFFQRGCAEAGTPTAWSDACPDLAAAVAPSEGVYGIIRLRQPDGDAFDTAMS